MKQLLLSSLGLLAIYAAQAQSNNPYDENGKKIVESARYLQAEIKAGKIKDLDEATVSYYSARLPIANKASVELVTEIIQMATKSSLEEVAEKSGMSSRGKEILMDINQNSRLLHAAAYRDYLTKTVEVIQNARLQPNEEEILLTGTSALYHHSPNDPTYVINDPVAAWTLVGLVGGHILCGPPCAAAGAVIGFIIGSLFVK